MEGRVGAGGGAAADERLAAGFAGRRGRVWLRAAQGAATAVRDLRTKYSHVSAVNKGHCWQVMHACACTTRAGPGHCACFLRACAKPHSCPPLKRHMATEEHKALTGAASSKEYDTGVSSYTA